MIKNWILLWLWQVLVFFPVSGKRIRQNTEENLRVTADGRITEGAYIENQPQLGALRFGRKYDFGYSGCTVIAVYNALLSLGVPVTAETLLEIAEDLQRHGVAWGGKFGVSPLSLPAYLKCCLQRYQGLTEFETESTAWTDPEVIERIGAESRTIIAVVWNGRRLRDRIHAVNIEKRAEGYVLHNSCHVREVRDGRNVYGEKGPFSTLSEAVAQVSSGRARPLWIIGLKKRGMDL